MVVVTLTPRKERKYIGKYTPKIDAMEKALGKVQFFEDVSLKGKFPGMIYCRIYASPYANATIKSMDSGKAEQLPGVFAVLRYDDPEVLALPTTTQSWTDMGVTPRHRDTLPRLWDRRYLDKTARWVGDHMGVAVAAESEEIANEALRLIDIEWEVRTPFLEVDEAKSSNATILHPEIDPKSNKHPHKYDNKDAVDDLGYVRGDVDKAIAEADDVIEVDKTYGGRLVNGVLDFRACLVKWDDDKLYCWSNHYNVDQTRMYFHCQLGLPLAKIRVRNGNCGAQMGKWNMGEQNYYVITALLSKRTGRPVKYKMNNFEEFCETRNMVNWNIKMAAKKDGTITALDFNGVGNSGGYYGFSEYVTYFICKMSGERVFGHVPNVRIRTSEYFTNRMPAGCIRSIANIQLCWALAQAIDTMAEKLGMDTIDVIKKSFGDSWHELPHLSMEAVLNEGAKRIGWENRHRADQGPVYEGCKKRGLGVAVWNQWHTEWQEWERGRIECGIRVNGDLSVTLQAPTKETGSGGNSAAVLACAEELSFLNIKPEDINWVAEGDSDLTYRDNAATDSAVSWLFAEIIHKLAPKVKEEFCKRAALMLKVEPEELDIEDARVFVKSDPSRGMSASSVIMDSDCLPVYVYMNNGYDMTITGVPYGAWFAEVEVDTEIGQVEVLRLVLVNDVGTVLHASGAESQQLGGQCMGLGESLTEEIFYDKATGTPLNCNYLDYKEPTLADYADIDPVLMEVWKGAGEYGCVGVAEGPLTGTAAAIANAVYNAVGIRLDECPMTPKRVINALNEKSKKDRGLEK